MRIRSAAVGFAVALVLSAPAGYALQEFTLEEAQTRIERLEARVASLEATIAAGKSATPEASKTHNISDTVVLERAQQFSIEGFADEEVGALCSGEAGFSDIRGGAMVRALDEAGNIVGSGSLNPGELVDIGFLLGCEFSWSIEVKDAEFYVFEIANRGGPSFSRADLEATDWMVALTIGD